MIQKSWQGFMNIEILKLRALDWEKGIGRALERKDIKRYVYHTWRSECKLAFAPIKAISGTDRSRFQMWSVSLPRKDFKNSVLSLQPDLYIEFRVDANWLISFSSTSQQWQKKKFYSWYFHISNAAKSWRNLLQSCDTHQSIAKSVKVKFLQM